MWGDFLSFYFRFYEVIILESTYATGEGKMQMYFYTLNYVCSWNQVICLLCIIYDLELIDLFSKLKHLKS